MLTSVNRGVAGSGIAYIGSMALSRKNVRIIVGLILVSLSGLMLLQVFLLNSAMELKEQTFCRNVANALGEAASALQAREAVMTAITVACDSAIHPDSISVMTEVIAGAGGGDTTMVQRRLWSDSALAAITGRNKEAFLDISTSQNVIIRVDDTSGHVTSEVFTTYGNSVEDPRGGPPDSSRGLRIDVDTGYFYVQTSDSLMGLDKIEADSVRMVFLKQVFNSIWTTDAPPIQDRLDSATINSVLQEQFTQAGIDLDYAFTIISEQSDALWPVPAEYGEELRDSEFSARLFPYDFLAPRSDLVVYFPGGKALIWKQVGPLLIPMVAFMLIIVYCFVYTIRTIIAQRRHASLMVDFVNNMTHEFKTPISTVALACDAIARPDVQADSDKLSRFVQMIREENLRMRGQTDKILQMAAMGGKDFELAQEAVNVHEAIEHALANLSLKIESRGGRVSQDLEADRHTVIGDPVHISNIIHNLLDNAVKYSPDEPIIDVSSKNGDKSVVIQITDRGVGINSEDMKSVFDKYYRVSTGNVHNVKGFGLGLSYVKLMVEAHGGKVSIRSKPGEGTRVEIILPLAEG